MNATIQDGNASLASGKSALPHALDLSAGFLPAKASEAGPGSEFSAAVASFFAEPPNAPLPKSSPSQIVHAAQKSAPRSVPNADTKEIQDPPGPTMTNSLAVSVPVVPASATLPGPEALTTPTIGNLSADAPAKTTDFPNAKSGSAELPPNGPHPNVDAKVGISHFSRSLDMQNDSGPDARRIQLPEIPSQEPLPQSRVSSTQTAVSRFEVQLPEIASPPATTDPRADLQVAQAVVAQSTDGTPGLALTGSQAKAAQSVSDGELTQARPTANRLHPEAVQIPPQNPPADEGKTASLKLDLSIPETQLPNQKTSISPHIEIQLGAGSQPEQLTSSAFPVAQNDADQPAAVLSAEADTANTQPAPPAPVDSKLLHVLVDPSAGTTVAAQITAAEATNKPEAGIPHAAVSAEPAGPALPRVSVNQIGRQSTDPALPPISPATNRPASVDLKKAPDRPDSPAKPKDRDFDKASSANPANSPEAGEQTQTQKQEVLQPQSQSIEQEKTVPGIAGAPPALKATSAKTDVTAPQVPGDIIDLDGDESIPAQLHSMVNTARLAQGIDQSELRIGMQMRELGNIDIRTSMAAHAFSAQIFVEHGEVAKTLTNELPGLYARLADQQVPAGQIQIHGSGLSASAGFDHSGRQRSEESHASTQDLRGFKPETKAAPILEAAAAGDRLDIRI